MSNTVEIPRAEYNRLIALEKAAINLIQNHDDIHEYCELCENDKYSCAEKIERLVDNDDD